MAADMGFVLGFVPVLFGTVALLIGVYANFSCTAFSFPLQGGGEILAGLLTYKTKGYAVVGDEIWVADVCVTYESTGFDYTTDKITSSVESLAIAAAVIGGIAVMCSCLAPCCGGIKPIMWKALGLLFLATCAIQGCTLMLYNSSICTYNPLIQWLSALSDGSLANVVQDPYQCQWASGFKMNIAAVVFWFVAGATTFCVPSPGSMDDEKSGGGGAAGDEQDA